MKPIVLLNYAGPGNCAWKHEQTAEPAAAEGCYNAADDCSQDEFSGVKLLAHLAISEPCGLPAQVIQDAECQVAVPCAGITQMLRMSMATNTAAVR